MFDIKITLFSFNLSVFIDKSVHQKLSSMSDTPLPINSIMQLVEQNKGKFKFIEDKFNKHYQDYLKQLAIYDTIPDVDFYAKTEQFKRANEELLQMCKWAEETILINQELVKLQHQMIRKCLVTF